MAALGMLLRAMFRHRQAFAANLGVVPVTVVTAWIIAAIALGAVLATSGLAVGPSLAAARSRPANLLKAE